MAWTGFKSRDSPKSEMQATPFLSRSTLEDFTFPWGIFDALYSSCIFANPLAAPSTRLILVVQSRGILPEPRFPEIARTKQLAKINKKTSSSNSFLAQGFASFNLLTATVPPSSRTAL
ncbi:hypothetical protein OIU84_010943 [Salix udensis]|uniref:Uncharacterized protein n=1 Tax=Salix udensis TaxID=889485 RepID=A0AAD6JM91_9ROSI|nr:hypothetical protein OIU84_010943 [Salix udensis]